MHEAGGVKRTTLAGHVVVAALAALCLLFAWWQLVPREPRALPATVDELGDDDGLSRVQATKAAFEAARRAASNTLGRFFDEGVLPDLFAHPERHERSGSPLIAAVAAARSAQVAAEATASAARHRTTRRRKRRVARLRGAAVQSRLPVSVVIASYSRVHNLVPGVLGLLRLEPLRRNGSEILISHGSAHSYAHRHAVTANVSASCAASAAAAVPTAVAACPDAAATTMLRHIDTHELDARMVTATRYHAATLARNDVLLHLDDDLVPSEATLQRLIDRVAAQPGFPHTGTPTAAAATAAAGTTAVGVPSAPGLYGACCFARSCGVHGYRRRTWRMSHQRQADGDGAAADAPFPLSWAAPLTNMAATSKALNARYLEAFEASFGRLIRQTRGNGEDLTFAFAAAQHASAASEGPGGMSGGMSGGMGSSLGWVGECGDETRGVGTWRCGAELEQFTLLDNGGRSNAFHTEAGHYAERHHTCLCLGAGLLGSDLAACVAWCGARLVPPRRNGSATSPAAPPAELDRLKMLLRRPRLGGDVRPSWAELRRQASAAGADTRALGGGSVAPSSSTWSPVVVATQTHSANQRLINI